MTEINNVTIPEGEKSSSGTGKGLTPYALVVSALLVAGAVIFTGFYLKTGAPTGSESLEQSGGPAAVGETEPTGEGTAEGEIVQEETPQYATDTVESFVRCLKDKGLKFYGASWCGWCNKQKEEIGPLGKELLYVECIDEKTEQMTPACQQAGISSFPTWILQDGTKNPGYKPLDQLAQLSGCLLK